MKISFSQFGEDLVIVDQLLNLRRARRGIYIDAGCYDPFRHSNTRMLNLLGWSGINVDASEKSIRAFQAHRPNDVNICAALSDREESNEFFSADGGEHNRLLRCSLPILPWLETAHRVPVTTQTLMSIFDRSRFFGETVDLLSIDCEGSDLAVLRGFDLGRTRPVMICIEALREDESQKTRECLGEHGYSFLCGRGPSLIFRDSSTMSKKS